MKNLMAVFLFIYAINPLFAQELLYPARFNEFLPGAFKSNPEFHQLIQANISNLGRLDPLLIHPYLDYVNRFWGKAIKNNDTNGWNDFKYSRMKRKEARNEWAGTLKDKVALKLDTRLQRNRLEDVFEELFEVDTLSGKPKIAYPLDTAAAYFCALKYLVTNTPDVMEQNRNYLQSYAQAKDEFMNDFNNKYKIFGSLNLDEMQLTINKYLDRWYLFEHDQSPISGNGNTERLAEMIIILIKNEYPERRKIGIEAAVEFGKWDTRCPVDLTNVSLIHPNYSKNYSITYTNQASINLVYSIPLNYTIGFLSRIDVSAGYITAKTEIDPGFDQSLCSTSFARYGGTYDINYYNRKKEFVSQKFSLSASVPVFYYSKNLSLHLGIFSSIQFTKTDFSIEESQNISTIYGNDNVLIYYPYSVKKTHIEVAPMLSIHYAIWNFLVFGTYKAPSAISTGIGCYWQF